MAERPRFTGLEFLPKTIPLSLSGQLLQGHFNLRQGAPYRMVAQRYLIDSFNSWAPHMIKQPDDTLTLDPGRSGKIFEHLRLRFGPQAEGGFVKIEPHDVIGPDFTPNECRLQHRDYDALYRVKFVYYPSEQFYQDFKAGRPTTGVPINLTHKTGSLTSDNDVWNLYRFPIMVGGHTGAHQKTGIASTTTIKEIMEMGECLSDGFGYFLIAGNEKSMTIHEKTRSDRINLYTANIKAKKVGKNIAEMISKYLHVTRKIAVTHFPLARDDGKIRRIKALMRPNVLREEAVETLIAAGLTTGLAGYSHDNVDGMAPTKCEIPCLQIMLNCFDYDGVMLLPFLIYYFGDLFIPQENLMLMSVHGDRVPSPDEGDSPLNINQFFVEATNYFFMKLQPFIDPSIHQEVYQLLLSDLAPISANFTRAEFAGDGNIAPMAFLDWMEDYVYWRIRPENIDIKYIDKRWTGEKSKATGTLRRATSNGVVQRDKLQEIIRVNFFQDPNLSSGDEVYRLQMFNTLMTITSRLIGRVCGKADLDNQNDLGVRKFDGPGKIYEDVIGQSLELIFGGIQYEIDNERIQWRMDNIGPALNKIGDELDGAKSGLSNITKAVHGRFTKSVSPTPKDILATEIMKRENMLTPVSEVTRKNIPIRRVTKGERGFAIRILKASELGYTDPSETPERNATGLVKHNALTCETSFDRDRERQELEIYLLRHFNSRVPISRSNPDYKGMVVLNGRVLGWGDAETMYHALIKGRRIKPNVDITTIPSELKDWATHRLANRGDTPYIPYDTAIHIDRVTLTLSISMEASRPIRPLLTMEDQHLILEAPFRIVGHDDWIHSWGKFVKLFSLDPNTPSEIITGQLETAFNWSVAEPQYYAINKATQFLYDFGAIEYVDAQEQSDIYLAQRLEDVVKKPFYEIRLGEILIDITRRVPIAEEETTEKYIDFLRNVGVKDLDKFQSLDDIKKFIDLAKDNLRIFNEKKNEKDTPELLVLKDKKILADQSDLHYNKLKGLLISIPEELDRSKRNNYTHSEINPVVMFGAVGSSIPRANSTEGPRNTLEDSMAKQALGTYHTNPLRMDGVMRNLAFPSQPLCQVEAAPIIGTESFPTGQMANLAVISTLGQTQEDSHIVDQRYLDYGGASVVVVRTKKKVVTSDSSRIEYKIIHPYSNIKEYRQIRRRQANWYYRHLDRGGLPRKGSYLREGDCIIGCISRRGGKMWEDDSIFVSPGEEGFVDSIFYHEAKVEGDHSGKKDIVVRIRFRVFTAPQIGDKFATRYSQKATIGLILHPFDLPSTTDGMIPSFIINPHAILARRTVGLPLELVGSRLAAMTKQRVNVTSFQHYDHDGYEENFFNYELAQWDPDMKFKSPTIYEMEKMDNKIMELENRYNLPNTELCKRRMFSGETCEEFSELIMIGSVFNRNLRHMVTDKFQARGRGRRSDITFEPQGGRGNYGAVRFGEMELAAIKTLGVDEIVYDRMSYASGEVHYVACNRCGNQAKRNKDTQRYSCVSCDLQGGDPPTVKQIIAFQTLYFDALKKYGPNFRDLPPDVERPKEPPFIMLRTRRAWNALRAYLAGLGIQVRMKFEPNEPVEPETRI